MLRLAVFHSINLVKKYRNKWSVFYYLILSLKGWLIIFVCNISRLCILKYRISAWYLIKKKKKKKKKEEKIR
jgi:hypothetical protein